LIKDLDALDPGGESYDGTVRQLMRETLHHVADEESVLLDQAERVLGPQLTTIGMRMSLRRADLLRARAGEVASNALQLAGVPLLLATRTLSRAVFGLYWRGCRQPAQAGARLSGTTIEEVEEGARIRPSRTTSAS